MFSRIATLGQMSSRGDEQKPLCPGGCDATELVVKTTRDGQRQYHSCPKCMNYGSSVSRGAGVQPPMATQQTAYAPANPEPRPVNSNNNSNKPIPSRTNQQQTDPTLELLQTIAKNTTDLLSFFQTRLDS